MKFNVKIDTRLHTHTYTLHYTTPFLMSKNIIIILFIFLKKQLRLSKITNHCFIKNSLTQIQP